MSSPLPDELQAALQSVLDDQREAYDFPGAIAGVWTPEGSWVGAVGSTQLDGTTEPTTADHTRIGSLTKTFTSQQMVDYMKGDDPLFPAGTEVNYSNTNTVLLGMLVEQVTGQPFAEVLAARVLEPLGLANTPFPTVSPELPTPYFEGTTLQGDPEGEEKDATFWSPLWAFTAETQKEREESMNSTVSGNSPVKSYALGFGVEDGPIGNSGTLLANVITQDFRDALSAAVWNAYIARTQADVSWYQTRVVFSWWVGLRVFRGFISPFRPSEEMAYSFSMRLASTSQVCPSLRASVIRDLIGENICAWVSGSSTAKSWPAPHLLLTKLAGPSVRWWPQCHSILLEASRFLERRTWPPRQPSATRFAMPTLESPPTTSS